MFVISVEYLKISGESLQCHQNILQLTCKLLGLAGDTEYPLSLVDEMLPDGLVRLSLFRMANRSVLSFRPVPLAVAAGAAAAPAGDEAVVEAGGDAGWVSS